MPDMPVGAADIPAVSAQLILARIDQTDRSVQEIIARIDTTVSTAVTAAVTAALQSIEERFTHIETKFEERVQRLEEASERKTRALELKLSTLEETNRRMGADINGMRRDMHNLHGLVEGQEQYGRLMNVRIENIPYNCDPKLESDEALLEILNCELKKIDIELEKPDIVRFHRNQKAYLKDDKHQAQVIIKVATWKARMKFKKANARARALKLPIRCHADLTKDRHAVLSHARERINRAMKLKYTAAEIRNNEIPDAEKCFAFATDNCELLMRCNGRVFPFSNTTQFDDTFRAQFEHRRADPNTEQPMPITSDNSG